MSDSGLDNRGMRKTFRNPGDMRGMPRVFKHTPIPVRDTPLPGTKSMLCPKDEQLKELVTHRSIETFKPSPTAKVLGALAMVGSVCLLSMIWVNYIFDRGEIWSAIMGAAFVHVFAIFSQILSSGRNNLGPWALLVLYGGTLLSAVLAHFLA